MKLNLGCGHDHLPGWVNVDRSPAFRPDVVHDLARLPWPFRDGCAEEVLLRRLPEPQDGGGVLAVLAELHRVCAPGATVRVVAGGDDAAAPMPGLAFQVQKALPAQPLQPPPAVRWEGSQFVYHSLAHVNRQLCLGLLRTGKVNLSLTPTEPARFDGAAEPTFRPLAACIHRSLGGVVQVHVRHQWQPHFDPPAEGAWVMIQPWEYGGLPQEWIAPMRDLVDEIWVPTAWLKDCYVASGIPEGKVVVVPNGVDGEVFRPEGERFPLRTTKTCKFLYLGYTIHRKGIDVLLEAYVRAFRAHDDVCLVIKGLGSGGYGAEDLPAILARSRAEDPQGPEIEYLADDLDETQVAALYRTCDALVLPYRGESFGLPIVEAMASGLPAIVTGRGAAMDYLRGDCAYLVPSRTVPVQGPMGFTPGPAGFWLEEPDPAALAELLRQAYLDPAGRRGKGRRGREHALAELGWTRPAAIALERLEQLAARSRTVRG